jgi:hypothetical protein
MQIRAKNHCRELTSNLVKSGFEGWSSRDFQTSLILAQQQLQNGEKACRTEESCAITLGTHNGLDSVYSYSLKTISIGGGGGGRWNNIRVLRSPDTWEFFMKMKTDDDSASLCRRTVLSWIHTPILQPHSAYISIQMLQKHISSDSDILLALVLTCWLWCFSGCKTNNNLLLISLNMFSLSFECKSKEKLSP